jgi:hypothetical protein
MACRGQEHEVVLIWSVTSGKRTILQDGQEVFYSLSRGNKFEHSWTSREGMIIKLIAYDFVDSSPTGLQYDLRIHGQSFFKVKNIKTSCHFQFITIFIFFPLNHIPFFLFFLKLFDFISYPKFMSWAWL